jgi:hypothetical protein
MAGLGRHFNMPGVLPCDSPMPGKLDFLQTLPSGLVPIFQVEHARQFNDAVNAGGRLPRMSDPQV